MAKFEVGNTFGKGRPVGKLNRSTEELKLTIARAVNGTLNTISDDLEKIRQESPERAIELSLKLMEYMLPKLSRTELKGDIEHKIHQISININKSGSEPRD